MLEARNIHKSYHNGTKTIDVLRGVHLQVAQGSFTSIVGPSGAGKSTLLHIVGGLDSPTQGSVIFDGDDMYALEDAVLCKIRNQRIGFVFQFYHLLAEFTVLENVLLPAWVRQGPQDNNAQVKKEAIDLLTHVGLQNRLTHFPSQLSGGEQQRVALVRALINKPGVLLCDEPTGNLDSKTGNEIIGLIKRLHKENNMAVILVTHNIELAHSADKVYNLKDGVLVH